MRRLSVLKCLFHFAAAFVHFSALALRKHSSRTRIQAAVLGRAPGIPKNMLLQGYSNNPVHELHL